MAVEVHSAVRDSAVSRSDGEFNDAKDEQERKEGKCHIKIMI